MSVEAYPLQWPDGWPRTPAHQRESDNRFGGSSKRVPYPVRAESLSPVGFRSHWGFSFEGRMP